MVDRAETGALSRRRSRRTWRRARERAARREPVEVDSGFLSTTTAFTASSSAQTRALGTVSTGEDAESVLPPRRNAAVGEHAAAELAHQLRMRFGQPRCDRTEHGV